MFMEMYPGIKIMLIQDAQSKFPLFNLKNEVEILNFLSYMLVPSCPNLKEQSTCRVLPEERSGTDLFTEE